MNKTYLLSSTGMLAIARYVRADTLFAFNLDSILAQDCAANSDGRIPEPIKMVLLKLMNVAKVAVLTGRSREDALAALGFEPHLLTDTSASKQSAQEGRRNWQNVKFCLKWREQLYDMLCHIQGVEIELLGESISLHYRRLDNPEKALSVIDAAIAKLDPSPRRFDGDSIINLLPGKALTKGEALLAALEFFGASKAVYFGTMESDGEVFQLKHADVFGIHIGSAEKTAACYLLSLPELSRILNSMVGILETN